MVKAIKILLTLSTLILLSACGSPGGSSAVAPSTTTPVTDSPDEADMTTYTVRKLGSTGTVNFEICYNVNTTNESCETHSLNLVSDGSDGVGTIELESSPDRMAHTVRITAPWEFQVSNPEDPYIDLNYGINQSWNLAIAYISF